MVSFANPSEDLPQPWRRKRIIFYASALKVYGQIPYILQRRLQAEFVSNNVSGPLGGRLIGPTAEQNYTLVPYRRDDGSLQPEEAVEELLDWLFEDRGVEWGIAAPGEFGRTDLALPNWFNRPPETFVPARPADRTRFRRLLTEEEANGNSRQ